MNYVQKNVKKYRKIQFIQTKFKNLNFNNITVMITSGGYYAYNTTMFGATSFIRLNITL